MLDGSDSLVAVKINPIFYVVLLWKEGATLKPCYCLVAALAFGSLRLGDEAYDLIIGPLMVVGDWWSSTLGFAVLLVEEKILVGLLVVEASGVNGGGVAAYTCLANGRAF